MKKFLKEVVFYFLMKIPRCMSTQHPDNVNSPFFSESAEIGGEEEIKETFYAFSHLGCDEQMWDVEGKEIDTYVVKKLITKYRSYFEENRLGEDVFLTLRVPNPTVEKAEAKILLETLESIPRSFDASNLMYRDEVAPIFEVILPMTTSSTCIDRVYKYYSDFVVGKQKESFKNGDITIADWIGRFYPEKINVIPLIEDYEHMIDVDNILRQYLSDKKVDYHRVFLARSDPAMNYGLVSAVLINKIALQRIYHLSEELNIPLYPIVGVGSAPFRGNLDPKNVKNVAKEYPYTYTFTIQSAFKFDNSPEEVIKAIKILKQRKQASPRHVEEERCIGIIDKYAKEYERQILKLAPIINLIAKFVPSRRKRKLHIGLFGYSRSIGEITLPRAITFTAALYSIGLPPEILGLNALDDKDLEHIKTIYVNFENDLKEALQFYNPETKYLEDSVRNKLDELSLDYETHEDHLEYTNSIITSIRKNRLENLSEMIIAAGECRKFLG